MSDRGVFHQPGGGEKKKLIGAAQYWCGGFEIDETAEDAKLFGIELPKAPRVNHFEVIPAAWPAVSMFLRVQTQWRASSGAIIGLDYSAVRWCFEICNVENQRELLDDLQVIEGKIVEILNERKK